LLRLASAPRDSEGSARTYAPIRVVLADEHAVVRRTLRLLIDAAPDIKVVAEVTNLAAAIRQVDADHPDVLVVELGLTRGSGIELVRRLRERVPRTELVAVTMDESPLFALQTIDAGIVGFVLKDRADSELLNAIRLATHGDEFVSPRVIAGLNALRRAAGGDGLGSREREVLRLIALGHTSAEIAACLHLSRRAIETLRARIYRTLGLRTRADLVQFALRRQMIGG
jgi:two-component system, NarL family, response regulator NreC